MGPRWLSPNPNVGPTFCQRVGITLSRRPLLTFGQQPLPFRWPTVSCKLRNEKKLEITHNAHFVVVFFHGNSTGRQHGVEFQVTDRGTSLSKYQPKMVKLDLNSPSYTYKFPPAPLNKYAPNERLFIMIGGAVGLHTHISVENVDIDGDYNRDCIKIPYYNATADSIWALT